tara:strand:- start:458 stop:973 length:516 start_codon:yes stop_codon:yes gene_type:complete
MTKSKAFTTNTVDVVWAHLHAPDDKFGADSSNHNITIGVDEELQMKLDELLQEMGAEKINGLRQDDEGRTVLKAKTKTFVKQNKATFPCRDAGAKETEATPFGGDKVRLRLSPAVITRDNSLSFYLNGCQIIEKTEGSYDGGFDAVEGGFDGSEFTPPVQETEGVEEDMPF